MTVESPPVVSIEIESAGQWGLQNVKLGEKRNNIGTGGIPIQKIKNTGNVPVLVDIGYSAPSQGGVMPGTQQGTDTFIMMLDSAVIPPISKINFGKVIQPGVAEPLPLTYGAPTGLSGQINGMSLNLEIRAYAANQVNNPSPHSVE
ncbi:MAG: hypothetical protein NTV07_00685 [Candidatus Omnitrophica bacterium]|nr:hypothetical protein [Candidatus Omnitrophota bacterium]